MRTFVVVAAVAITCMLQGCRAFGRVQYYPMLHVEVPPTERAVLIEGRLDNIADVVQRSQLPHLSEREQFRLRQDIMRQMTGQIGSPDYLAIGEIVGNGTASDSLESLKAAMVDHCQRVGGEVLFVIDQTIDAQPYVRAVPGYSYATATAQPGYANTTFLGNQAYTTYQPGAVTVQGMETPGYVVSGTNYYPRVRAVAFRRAPGVSPYIERLIKMPDDQFARVYEQVQAYDTPRVTFDDFVANSKAVIDSSSPR